MTDLTEFANGRRWGTIVADPPWPSRSNPGKRANWLGSNMQPRYRTMTATRLIEMPVGEVAAPDSILVLWTTWMHLHLAICCMQEWGFQYATGMPWLKVIKGQSRSSSAVSPIYGPGVWFQHCTELVLIGRRGRPFGQLGNPRPARKGVIIHPRLEHSEKPGDLQEWIERTNPPFPKPRIELFARRQREGWTCWGDEV